MSLTTFHSSEAPAAVGPYAQAVAAGGLLFCSGQLGLDPATGQLAAEDAAGQARQALANLAAVLTSAGCAKTAVARTTIFLATMTDFAAVNAVYAEFFGAHRPARACVAVAELPLGGRVEIDCVAELPLQGL